MTDSSTLFLSLRRALAVFVAILAISSLAPAQQFSGAIFTSLGDGTRVNQNLYATKPDVYLNGGPQNMSSAGLPNGIYYFQVTEPNGTLLSTDPAVCRQLMVVNGAVAGAYADAACVAPDGPHANGAFNPANGSTPVQLIPFNTTSNNGGEYKVWLIRQTSTTSIDPNNNIVILFSNSDSKTDNFKIAADTPVIPDSYSISGVKFYDANVNGILDQDELTITGWKIELFGAATSNTTTDFTGAYSFVNLAAGAYGTCEVMPALAPVWLATTPTTISPINVPPSATDQNFGNVCLGAGGGLTLGFWSNKNGQALIGNDDLSMLYALNLRKANGDHFDGFSKAQFRTWLLNGTATNMAYMLSVQLSAMALNVHNGKVDGGAFVYVPGSGFTTINALMAAANTELGNDGITYSGDPNRATQEALKNALDAANNNLNFVQPSACAVNYRGDEPSCAPTTN